MNQQLLINIGEFLYGKHWRAPLAKALDVNERTVRHWAAGSRINTNVSKEIWELFEDKMETGYDINLTKTGESNDSNERMK